MGGVPLRFKREGFFNGRGVRPASEAARSMQAQELCMCKACVGVAGSSPCASWPKKAVLVAGVQRALAP